jgi:uncharacterized protein YfbU (UPF0304 family)
MVFSHQHLFLGLDFVEDLPNPFCIKLLDPWIKTETKKNFNQRRLDFDGFWNVIASRLVFLKALLAKKERVYTVSKCDQPNGRTPANAPVLQSRRCIFHAVGASL